MSIARLYLSLFLVFLVGSAPVIAEPVSHDRFALHAIPKCGTHFIQRLVKLLTGRNSFNANLTEEGLRYSESHGAILRSFQLYSPEHIQFLKAHHTKLISIYRDPRDALISHLFYMQTFKGQGTKRDFFSVSNDFDDLSFDDQLTSLILGTGMTSYLDFYYKRIGWTQDPYCLAVRYEDLVGFIGGGSDELQCQTIVDIANYLNMELSSEKLHYVMDNCYQKQGDDIEIDGQVFKRSSTGNWQMFFKPNHKKLFKKRFGRQLIELGYEKNMAW